jgi:hypothetical protein
MRSHISIIDIWDIQGNSGGICNTLGNVSMCDSKQKSSYEHGYDFEVFLTQFFTLATHGDSPFVLRRM